MNYDNITVVICCAGMGTRLGIGSTKALVKIDGKSIISRQLEMLANYKDIRIVVGYQAERVIEHVNQIRKDIIFAFNYEYKTTGTAASLCKALICPKEYVVILDGDMLVNEEDFEQLIALPGEAIGITDINSDIPVFVKVDDDQNVIEFSVVEGDAEWSGISKVKSSRLNFGEDHIYDLLTPLLPIKAYNIRSREVDTPDDYDRLVEWVKLGKIY